MGLTRASALALALVACGSGESTPSPTPSPPSPTTSPIPAEATPTEATPTEASMTPPPSAAPTPAADAPDPVLRESSAGATVERAIEPSGDFVGVVATVERGRARYVLYTLDAGALAQARLETGDELRAEAITDALDDCEGRDDYGRLECLLRVSPSFALAAGRACEARSWGIAKVEERDGSFVASLRRSLFAITCGESDEAPELRARDLDGDGEPELTVRFGVSLLRDDLGMGGGTNALLTFVLDEELRTQLRVTSTYDFAMVDVGGTTTTCEAHWRLEDTDADGHDDVSLRGSCEETQEDELEGGSRPTRSRASTVCPYVAGVDAWVCPERVGDWVFERGDGGFAAERLEDLAVPQLGTETEARVAAYREVRAREDTGEDGDDADATGEAPPPPAARACQHVVEDPAPPLRVRAAPSARSDIVGELANGTVLELGERRGRWARVAAPHVGWVYTESLRERCE